MRRGIIAAALFIALLASAGAQPLAMIDSAAYGNYGLRYALEAAGR